MESQPAGLTPREQEVLALLARGRANKAIAECLRCSTRTVEFHISNLLRKTGASSRLELVTHAQRDTPLAPTRRDLPFIEIRVFAGVAATTLGDTVLIMWTAPATLERWLWNAALIDQLAPSYAEGVQCLSMILNSSDAPDRFVRARMQADFSRFGQRLRRYVGVALGDSLWSGVVHSIMRCVFLLSGQSERLAVTASIQQGLSYILETAGPTTPSRSEGQRAIAELGYHLGVLDRLPPDQLALSSIESA